MSASRHVDTGAWLISFADEVLVRCTRCEAPGRVTTTGHPGGLDSSAMFRCDECGLVLDSQKKDWVGPVAAVGRRACGFCGHRWLCACESVEHGARPPEQVSVTCSVCQRASMVDVEPLRSAPEDRAMEPHLGLPLLLSVSTRHGTVWAYNERHLRELRSFVGAKLRLSRGAGNASMFSRLPAWMKSAKNRDDMLKALAKLESRLPSEAAAASQRVRMR